MCGIFGIIPQSIDDLSEIKSQVLKPDRLKHRGPDDTSIRDLDGKGLLGFHRLSIVGLTELANKILEIDDVSLTCNGEIYNYRELQRKYSLPNESKSDCEVILRLYLLNRELPDSLINELDGVFSFVLYDNSGDLPKVIIARDRVGVRPLFYYKTDEFLAFSSERKGIQVIDESKDEIVEFPPGNVYRSQFSLVAENNRTRLSFYLDSGFSRFYSFPETKNGLRVNYTVSQSIIRELLTDAVSKRLHSDRPIGFLVSGGLDSSLVASIAKKLTGGQKIVTFSIGLEDAPDLRAAREVAAFLDSEHHEIVITEQQIIDCVESVVKATETYDITTIRASVPMFLISEYISKNTDIRVIFSGEGADELFGGYLYFHNAPSFAEFQEERRRLVSELSKYDVLRADRTTAAWGLELRVPFLDADLVDFVLRLGAEHLKPDSQRIEKSILRRAFDGYLPERILYRQKNAFSDAVGKGSVETLKELARSSGFEDESLFYLSLYQKYYPDYWLESNWMPRWCDGVTDPSATVLEIFGGDTFANETEK